MSCKDLAEHKGPSSSIHRTMATQRFYELRRKGKSLQESNDVHPQKSVESSN